MSSLGLDDDERDRRLLCHKFNGAKGESFRRFKDEFLPLLHGMGDDDASLMETLLGTDTAFGASSRRHA